MTYHYRQFTELMSPNLSFQIPEFYFRMQRNTAEITIMMKTVTLALLIATLTGCSYFQVHRLTVEQGNVITQENARELRTGMSRNQVEAIMGTPLLVNLFSPNRVEYIYTVQEGHSPRKTTRLSCLFSQGRLQSIVKS